MAIHFGLDCDRLYSAGGWPNAAAAPLVFDATLAGGKGATTLGASPLAALPVAAAPDNGGARQSTVASLSAAGLAGAGASLVADVI